MAAVMYSWKCSDCGETSKRNPRLSLSDHMERTHSKRWAGEKLGFVVKESKDETMPVENEDWESERVYGHTIERPKDEHRCQVKAKVQCVLQEHTSTQANGKGRRGDGVVL